MSNYSINNLYPKPAIKSGANGNGPVLGQGLTVTSGAAVQLAAFDSNTSLVAVDVQNADVYCTFDGQTPSSTKGHHFYAGDKFLWSAATATAAKFIAVAGNSFLWASEFSL